MREPYVQNINIQRPAPLGGGEWSIHNLNSITVVFGKNGSGKSLMMRTWADTAPETIHYVVPERTGELGYHANFLTQQISAQERRGLGRRNFLNEYRRHVIARIQAYFAARGNVRGDQLPGDPEDLERLIGQLVPDFVVNLRGIGSPPYEFIRVATQQPIGNIDEMSSGEAQLITLALDVLTMAAIWEIEGREERIMLIDEPDAHIHPDLQVRFADFLVQVTEKYDLQVLVATHSTTLMAALGQFGADAASVMYLDRISSDFTAEQFTVVTKELASCLGGHALMGPLFGVPLLLVEGDDDYRIWSQVPRHHQVSFAVIPSHGDEIKRYQKTLEKLFASLREPDGEIAGYALIDADKGKPQADANTPQDHIRYIQLVCHESENLYLADEVLEILGYTWADASAKIAAEAQNYGNKADTLGAAPDWDRQSEDIKNVINEIAKILDGKNVHWTVRVAQVIGRQRPEGQIADFLGAEVVDTLWGEAPAE
jgi:predicted ATPase